MRKGEARRGVRLGAALAMLTAAGVARLPAQETGADEGAFRALQHRGEEVMGVNQYTSSHRFEPLPDGGRIVLERDVDDPRGVAVIREHMRGIAGDFARGDFGDPSLLHGREVPGSEAMRRMAGAITYSYRERPRGAEVRISTSDPEARAAIHAFLAFQRHDHRAGGGP